MTSLPLLEMTLSYLAKQQPGRPLPEGVPPLPDGYVYLGTGRGGNTHGYFDLLSYYGILDNPRWQSCGTSGNCSDMHYACYPDLYQELKGHFNTLL